MPLSALLMGSRITCVTFLLGFAEAGLTQEKKPKVSRRTAAADKLQAGNVQTAAAYESDESGIIAGLRRMLPREEVFFRDNIHLLRRRRPRARRWALVVRADSRGGRFSEDDGNRQWCSFTPDVTACPTSLGRGIFRIPLIDSPRSG